MRKRSGYVLLEIIISVFIMSIIITCLLSIMAVINRANKNIEDRIELSQQTEEITSQITPLIEESMYIISITTIDRKTIQNLELGKEYDVLSIKLNFKNSENENNIALKNREISYKKSSKKLFINTLRSNNASETGGYEIGDYVKSIRIKKKSSNIICLILNLEKNNMEVEKSIKLYVRYDKLLEDKY